MLNQSEESFVRQVVACFMSANTLFTALDVSNEVKKTCPQVRHREVRDVVRALFITDIEPSGWARTDITVNLEDGNSATALLYHPLSSMWDLDALYDNQKRNQVSVKSPAPVAAPAVVCSGNGTTVQSSVGLAVNAASLAAQATSPVTQTVQSTAVRDLWGQMFSSQPSLFPRR